MLALNIDSSNTFQIQTQTLVGRSVAVLGITGSGKTNTAAVLIEELLSNGLPLTVVDIEGEYWSLKEKFEVLVAGRSQHAELEVGPNNAAQLAEISLKRGISIILDQVDRRILDKPPSRSRLPRGIKEHQLILSLQRSSTRDIKTCGRLFIPCLKAEAFWSAMVTHIAAFAPQEGVTFQCYAAWRLSK
jgi:hypothetical protein